MTKKTKAEILVAIADLDASGGKISVRAVRDHLGGGSMSDIAPIVKEYSSTRSLDTAPEKVYSALASVADQIWADASTIAKENWNTERIDLHSRLEDVQAELDEVRGDLELKETTVTERDEQITELKASHKADKADLMSLVEKTRSEAEKAVQTARVEAQKAIAEETTATKAAEAEKSRVETANTKLEAQLESAKEQVSMLKDMLAKFEPTKTKN